MKFNVHLKLHKPSLRDPSHVKALSKHVPRKKKLVSGIQMSIMIKCISKEVIKCSRLRTRFLKNESRKNEKMLYKQ